jgi:Predicted membrane protein (DUF2306)
MHPTLAISELGAIAAAAPRARNASPDRSRRWLLGAGRAWFALALGGQLLFAIYIVGFYGGHAFSGDLLAWNKVLPRGWVMGDMAGNAMVAVHVLFTAVIVGAGLGQLVPAVRQRWPALHRWNGRLFIAVAATLALTGLAMMFGRGAVGGPAQHAALLFNAVLILAYAGLAWRSAHARQFDVHRRWALRLWLAVAGVWFFRIGLAAWLLIHRAPVGFDPETFTGPLLVALAWGQTLLPLLVLEAVLRAERAQAAPWRWAATALLLPLSLLTALGVAGAAMMMWLPRL